MKEKLIMLLFGAFVSLATLYIYEAREQIEPVTAATSQQIKNEETTESQTEPEQEEFTPLPINLDTELQHWIKEYAYGKNISPALIIAIIEKESDYNAGAIGDGGEAIGLMQIQKKWHKDRMDKLGVTDLQTAEQNITVGVDYLIELFCKNPDAEWVLNAYNGGQAYADRIEQAGITTDYAEYILNRAAELEREWER